MHYAVCGMCHAEERNAHGRRGFFGFGNFWVDRTKMNGSAKSAGSLGTGERKLRFCVSPNSLPTTLYHYKKNCYFGKNELLMKINVRLK